MKRWTVTGPIGAGKSSLTRLLAAKGAAVLDGDRLGHEVLDRPAIKTALVQDFGEAVLVDDRIDRGRLGALVFADPEAMVRLNSLTHGPLCAHFEARLQALADGGKHALAVLEAAVYFLLPDPPLMDLVICVDAPAAIRLDRLVEGKGLTPAQALARVRSQDTMAGLWAAADVHIINDRGERELSRAADDLWKRHLTGA